MNARKDRGFSLVELMVGVMIGLIGIAIIMQVFTLSEAQKRTTTSGSDAQSNGNMAIYGITRDVRLGGYGFGISSYGCTVNTSFNGSTATPGQFTLAPVVITDAGTDATPPAMGGPYDLPDRLRVLYSTANMGTLPDIVTVTHAQAATQVDLTTNFGIANQSLFVLFETSKTCTLAQVSAAPIGISQIVHISGPWNGNPSIFPAAGYTANNAVYVNMGGMALRDYFIDPVNGNDLQMTETSAAYGASSSNTFVIAGEIVNIQAEYGKDSGLHVGHIAGDNVVDTWDNVTPASGAGGAPIATPWQQIIAVHVALLVRSGQYEKPDPTSGLCTATTSTQTGGNAPTWTSRPTGLQAPVVRKFSVPNGYPSCYRYKVYETIVPLRNVIWGTT
jgi:type IV pilus assembly protein PilW